MNKQTVLVLLGATFLSACGSAPVREPESDSAPAPVTASRSTPSGGYLDGDGPGADVPVNLDAIPDAVPQAEPLHRYANRPYTALGKTFTPLTAPGNYSERGLASWYGKKFHGQRTATGEIYDMYAMTAAHPTLPIPSYARVTHLGTNKSVIVRVNDRGPFLHGRIIDLSYTAAYKLGIIGAGSGEVKVESLLSDAIPQAVAITDPVSSEALPPSPAPPVADEPPVPAAGPADGSVYLQLGAFSSRSGAESFLARMRAEFEGSGKQVILYQKNDDLVRVHIGPYASQDEARLIAEKLQPRLGFTPFVSVH